MTELGLDIHGNLLRIEADTRDAADIVRTLFPSYVAPEGTSGPYRLRIETSGGDYRLTRGARRSDVAREDLPTVVEHAISRLLLEETRELVPLHAAGVESGGRRLLVLGDSGAGKSSMALAWSRTGYPILGDDVVFLDGELTAHPFMKPLKVATDRAVALGVSLRDTLYWEEDAEEVWYDPTWGGGWAGPGPVAGLAFLERRTEGAYEARSLPADECLELLLGQLMETGSSTQAWTPSLIELAGNVPAQAVSFSDSRDAAERLARWDPPPR